MVGGTTITTKGKGDEEKRKGDDHDRGHTPGGRRK
jgi:hypothetical protein